MEQQYIAISFGPIARTIEAATKTREIWMASYMISHLSKCFCEEVQKYAQLVIPHYPASVQSVDKAIGSYPDKIIAKINKGATLDKAEIQLEAITSWANAIGLNENQKAHALNYFHIGCFILSASELNSISSDSFIQTINRILDLYDMQHLYHPSASEFLKIFNTEKDNTIIKAMYKLVGRDIDNYKFPSIRQIAAADQSNEVQYKLSVLDETKLESSTKEEKIKLINRFNIELSELNLKKYHDYVAIITADGDNFGKYVSSLGNDLEALREFTRKVDSYNKLAATICIDYSATPIYIGGDDLLIFAPVLNNRAGINKSVFSLIQELDSSFKSTFNSIQFDIQGNKFKLTLSFGLSITYVKFPMREAIAMANRLLFEKVKSNQKNAVGVALVLHSGQEKSAVINKMVLNDLIVLISKFSSKDNILSSVIQSLLADEDMIVALLHTSHNLKNTKNLESYFIEKYDIDINHLTSKTAFANAVKDTVVNLLKNKNDEIVNDEIYVLNQANVIFRIIKFLADNESN